jgi:hypothetical protein
MPKPRQLPQIPVFPTGHPDLRKVILQHQLQNRDWSGGCRSGQRYWGLRSSSSSGTGVVEFVLFLEFLHS